jgi:hypothetical protein
MKMLYRLSATLIEEMRMVKAKGHLCFMAANLRVEEKDLEAIIKYGVVTERWLQWRFICDAVVAVYTNNQVRAVWKRHRVEYFKRA